MLSQTIRLRIELGPHVALMTGASTTYVCHVTGLVPLGCLRNSPSFMTCVWKIVMRCLLLTCNSPDIRGPWVWTYMYIFYIPTLYIRVPWSRTCPFPLNWNGGGLSTGIQPNVHRMLSSWPPGTSTGLRWRQENPSQPSPAANEHQVNNER